MKNILVTGGLGYIGSHTVVELQNEGYEAIIIDDLSNSSISVLENIKEITGKKPIFYQINLTNKNALKKIFSNHKLDGVIHFAAYKSVSESVSNPLDYYENNLSSLVNVLQEMRDRKLDNFIFSSSCTVYGQADKLPVTEKASIKPAYSTYGKTKQIGEDILKDASIAHKLNSISLRYFNPIGAHPSIKIGESSKEAQNIIPCVVENAAGIRKTLSIFGNDYNTKDGTAVRDYIHVVDLAKAHGVALKRLINKENKKLYEYFNLGTGKGTTVLEVIKTFERVNNLKLNYKIAQRRAGDIESAYADVSFANKELGWKTKKTLEEALESAWKWQQKLLTLN